VKYHFETSHKEGITKEEMMEAMGIAHWWRNHRCPHICRAYEFGSLRGRRQSNILHQIKNSCLSGQTIAFARN
jgi:hypothetical protein